MTDTDSLDYEGGYNDGYAACLRHMGMFLDAVRPLTDGQSVQPSELMLTGLVRDVSTLDLPPRVVGSFVRHKIETVGDIYTVHRKHMRGGRSGLYELYQIGNAAMQQLNEVLVREGYPAVL